MLLGVRWRGGHFGSPAPPPPLRGEQVELWGGFLRATPPARLELRGDEAVVWLAGSPGGEPDVRLTPDSLTVAGRPLPQYPIYYLRAPGDAFLAVCSELSPLLDLLLQPTIDVGRLVAVIASQLDADPAGTAFQDVRRLRPGERIHAGDAGFGSSTRLPLAGASYSRLSPADLAVELRAQLEAAVARATSGARRVAVFVGGGLDSSAVLALTLARSRGGDREVQAIAQTWASPGDDRPHLDTLESALGITAVRLPARLAGPWFARSLCVDAQPQTFAAGCSEMLLWSAAAARDADVALGGHGGDEVLGGEVSFAPLAARGRPITAVIRALRLQVPWSLSILRRVRGWVVSPLIRPVLPSAWAHARLRRAVRKQWMTAHFVDLLEPLLDRAPRRTPRTPDERLAYFCALPYFGELCRAWGQFTSATGVAPIDVFRDLELVRFVARIDPQNLTEGHRYRGLLRLALKGDLPDSVRLRPDKATAQPLVAEAAMAADARGLLEDLSSFEQLASLNLVDPGRLRVPFASWLRSLQCGERLDVHETDPSWAWLWPLLATEAFLRKVAASRRQSRPKGS